MAGNNNSDYTIHDVYIRQVAVFGVGGKSFPVTRVSIYIGPHGPFTQDFGPMQPYPDTPQAINQWKQQKVVDVQSAAS